MFIPSRKVQIRAEDIARSVRLLRRTASLYSPEDSPYQRDGFWSKLCTELGIPNKAFNRIRLRKIHLQKQKKHISLSEGEKEEELPISLGDESPEIEEHISLSEGEKEEELPISLGDKSPEMEEHISLSEGEKEEELPIPLGYESPEIEEHISLSEGEKVEELPIPLGDESPEMEEHISLSEGEKEEELPIPLGYESPEIEEHISLSEGEKVEELPIPLGDESPEIEDHISLSEGEKEEELPISLGDESPEIEEHISLSEGEKEEELPISLGDESPEIEEHISLSEGEKEEELPISLGDESPEIEGPKEKKSIEKPSFSNVEVVEKETQSVYSHRLPQSPIFFLIDESDWRKLRNTQQKNQFKELEWTNVMSKGLRSVYRLCSFGFVRHSVKVIGSIRSAPVFKCNGYCLFEDCPVKTEVIVHDERTLKAEVHLSGGLALHDPFELKRRPVRAEERYRISKELENKFPRTLYLKKLNEIDESVIESGNRDDAPTPAVLKNISWSCRKQERRNENEVLSLQKIVEQKTNAPEDVLQKVLLHPKGVMLWSQRSIHIFQNRAREDIIYLDATGSILQREKGNTSPFYVYELVVRNPKKGASPLPVATYVTCDHTTASVQYFLNAFRTDHIRQFGKKNATTPKMMVCDGSIVLQQAISHTFCCNNLNNVLCQYYKIVTGKASTSDFEIPIIHRCLSHVMKNAKTFSKKHIPNHYRLSMHIFGLLTSASTLKELDEIVIGATAVFSSPCSGPEVEKHFKNLQTKMISMGKSLSESYYVEADDLEDIIGPTPFDEHFKELIGNVTLDMLGDENAYYSKSFIPALAKYFLTQVALWSSLMLGDLGRHGEGSPYLNFSKSFAEIAQKDTQNFTRDNRTQGIMEKSQWDLKKIRFQRSKLTRLDDFVNSYQKSHTALLREYEDSQRSMTAKLHRVDKEKWKQRKQKKTGVYVSPISKPFVFKSPSTTKSAPKTQQPTLPHPSKNEESLKTLQGKDEDSVSAEHPEGSRTKAESTPVKFTPGIRIPQEKDIVCPVLAHQKTKKKRIKKGRSGPVWINRSPEELIPAQKLRFAPQIHPDQIISILDQHYWLSSDEIDITSYYLSQKHPDVDGFQSTLIYQTLRYGGVVGTPTQKFVQILNVNANHWVTVSNVFSGPNELCLYDSLNTHVHTGIQQALSWMIRPHAPQFTLMKPAVQRQKSGSSCGPFALAFAAVLCQGELPETCLFSEVELRAHLSRALREKRAPDFIFQKVQAKPVADILKIDVHCLCRTAHNNEVMVQCTTCENWYHPSCTRVPDSALDSTKEEWNCPRCSD